MHLYVWNAFFHSCLWECYRDSIRTAGLNVDPVSTLGDTFQSFQSEQSQTEKMFADAQTPPGYQAISIHQSVLTVTNIPLESYQHSVVDLGRGPSSPVPGYRLGSRESVRLGGFH